MSDSTADALGRHVEAAIRAAVEESGGGMVTAAFTLVSYIDCDGETSWAYCVEPGQRQIATLGLLRFATIAIDEQTREMFQ